MSRIAFYLPSFTGGGAERNTALIASEMARLGHEMIIVVDDDSGPNRALLDPRVEVAVLGGGHASHIRSLARTLDRWRADFVFARIGLSPLVAVAALALRRERWRVVVSYHNPYDPQMRRGGRLTWWTAALLTRASLATIAVSRDVASDLVGTFRAPAGKVSVIHNPVDVNWIASARDEPLPAAFPTSGPFILSAGRLVDQKGYPDLIRAFARIAGTIPEDLVIMGEGPNLEALRGLAAELGIEDRVHFAGYVDNPFPVYARARLFVLASHWEGFGNVIVEALACGTPVIATDCPGGPKEILAYGEHGPVVPMKRPEALAEAILATLAAPPDQAALRRRADDFALAKVARRYLSLLAGEAATPG